MNPKHFPFISEEEKCKIALNRTPTERFDLLMKLIRIEKMFRQAKIVHQKIDSEK